MFVDASAIIAIIEKEPEAPIFVEKLKNTKTIYSSALSKYEALAGLCRINTSPDRPILLLTIKESKESIDEFFNIFSINLIAIHDGEAMTALQAFQEYGKGVGHKAKLNMGDCFSYACAKNYKLPLLFKGNDFIYTDIERA